MRILIGMALSLISGYAVAATDFSHCQEQTQTELCQAYLAGYQQGQARIQPVEGEKAGNSFLTRALEQRAGERHRHLAMAEKVVEAQTQ
ncbi:hypothetical protein [Photobacterium sp. 1_MG-2023]|uniref:hypothetical protein n=1 Tax=Photobacterium sp. 1_MG-2023 TaxID=3062646 RepID=UPI0026E293AB|nr:hypothetical protein [Photobacterium sp. 1_MG-2023]MDO6704777.1 hypothetical protein [Photobacterium sp. 1_MG-2023]